MGSDVSVALILVVGGILTGLISGATALMVAKMNRINKTVKSVQNTAETVEISVGIPNGNGNIASMLDQLIYSMHRLEHRTESNTNRIGIVEDKLHDLKTTDKRHG